MRARGSQVYHFTLVKESTSCCSCCLLLLWSFGLLQRSIAVRHESSPFMSMNCEFLKTIAFHCCIAALILNSMPSVGCYFFCLKCISLCGQLPSRPKQKHYLYYHLTCGLHNILMYSFSKCQDFFILHASFLIPRTDFFSLRYRSFEKHLQKSCIFDQFASL